MIVVNARFESTAENIQALAAAISAVETATRAEEGCDDYTFSVELNDPGALRITERWNSSEALERHLGSAHIAEFQKAMGAYPPTGVDAKFYEVREIPRPGS